MISDEPIIPNHEFFWRPGPALRGFGRSQIAYSKYVLILLILIGIAYRFSRVNWSQGTNLHPDEYGLTSTLTQLSLPKDLGWVFQHPHLTPQPLHKI